jgi:hypothetical protein
VWITYSSMPPPSSLARALVIRRGAGTAYADRRTLRADRGVPVDRVSGLASAR